MAEVILKAKWIGNKINNNGRVSIVFSFSKKLKYSIKVDNIKEIWWDGEYYYIVYQTNNAEFYKQNFPTAEKPRGARCEVEKYGILVCSECGSEEWTWEDGGYCFACGKHTSPKKAWRLLIKTPSIEEVHKYALEQMGYKVEKVWDHFRSIGGGARIKFKKIIKEFEVAGRKAILGEDPEAIITMWDMDGVEGRSSWKGKYILVEEPDLLVGKVDLYLYKVL